MRKKNTYGNVVDKRLTFGRYVPAATRRCKNRKYDFTDNDKRVEKYPFGIFHEANHAHTRARTGARDDRRNAFKSPPRITVHCKTWPVWTRSEISSARPKRNRPVRCRTYRNKLTNKIRQLRVPLAEMTSRIVLVKTLSFQGIRRLIKTNTIHYNIAVYQRRGTRIPIIRKIFFFLFFFSKMTIDFDRCRSQCRRFHNTP